MTILLDACVPRPLRRLLPHHSVSTAQEMGWGDLKNGELISRAEQNFEAMITCDQNIRYQQNMSDRKLAILVLPINDWPTIRAHSIEISDKVAALKPGDFVELIW
jgi:hypothetical protein